MPISTQDLRKIERLGESPNKRHQLYPNSHVPQNGVRPY